MTQPLLTYNSQDLIYGYLLSSRFRSAWVYEPSNAALSEPDLWEIIRNDDDILSSLETRRSNLIRPWRVIPNPHGTGKNADKKMAEASKQLAGIVCEGLSYIDRFDAARRIMGDAYMIGRRYCEVLYEEKDIALDGTKKMKWFVPVGLKDVDRRRFHWVADWKPGPNGIQVKSGVHLDMFDTNTGNWVPLDPQQRARFIEYIWEDTEDRLGYGRGVWEALFFTHFFKTQTQKHLLEGLDRFANGMLIVKLDSLRSADPTLDNQTLASTTRTNIQKMRTEHVLTMQQGEDVEIVDAPGTGMSLSLEVQRYYAEKIHRLLNGSVRPAGHSVDGTGSKAAASEEADTSESFYQFPREDLDGAFDRDLVGGFLYWNAGNIEALGLGEARKPKFTSENVKKQDPKARIEVLNQSKVPIGKAYYYEAIDVPPPEPDEETVEPTAMDPMGGEFGAVPGKQGDKREKPENGGEQKRKEKRAD